MGKKDYCCAIGCKNARAKRPDLSYYIIPSKPEPRREAWIRNIGREDPLRKGMPWQPGHHTKLCSQHFISGKKSDSPTSPDYVPTVFSHHPVKRKLSPSPGEVAEKQQRLQYESSDDVEVLDEHHVINPMDILQLETRRANY